MSRDSDSTRARILDAADALFYAEGLNAVSLDRIAGTAGVTKKTLYYHFRSKDDLMGAYLDARHEPVMARYRAWAGDEGSVGTRLERMFARLAASGRDRAWRGCGFVRAACELADLPGHPASVAARRHKQAFEAWFRSLLESENRPNATGLARLLMVILDGAIVQTLIHRGPEPALAAGAAARMLLDASRPGGTGIGIGQNSARGSAAFARGEPATALTARGQAA